MSTDPTKIDPSGFRIPVDVWAVLLALVLALLVRFGALQHIPW